jgi:hypothetical protein
MAPNELDGLVYQLIPKVLADRDLGDGRTFTTLHLRNLWALSCLEAGRCCDEEIIAASVIRHLPAHVALQQAPESRRR